MEQRVEGHLQLQADGSYVPSEDVPNTQIQSTDASLVDLATSTRKRTRDEGDEVEGTPMDQAEVEVEEDDVGGDEAGNRQDLDRTGLPISAYWDPNEVSQDSALWDSILQDPTLLADSQTAERGPSVPQTLSPGRTAMSLAYCNRRKDPERTARLFERQTMEFTVLTTGDSPHHFLIGTCAMVCPKSKTLRVRINNNSQVGQLGVLLLTFRFNDKDNCLAFGGAESGPEHELLPETELKGKPPPAGTVDIGICVDSKKLDMLRDAQDERDYRFYVIGVYHGEPTNLTHVSPPVISFPTRKIAKTWLTYSGMRKAILTRPYTKAPKKRTPPLPAQPQRKFRVEQFSLVGANGQGPSVPVGQQFDSVNLADLALEVLHTYPQLFAPVDLPKFNVQLHCSDGLNEPHITNPASHFKTSTST